MRFSSLSLFVLLFSLSVQPTTAQEVGPLPDHLSDALQGNTVKKSIMKTEPDAVVRLNARRLEVKGVQFATLHVRKTVTIFSREGRNQAQLRLPYDAFRSIDDLSGTIYDIHGEPVDHLKDEDIRDRSATASYSLYDERRIRVATLYHDTYPYTVEFTYKMKYDGYIDWPTWHPQRPDVPVEYAHYEVEAPKHLQIRTSTAHTDSLSFTSTIQNGHERVRWTAQNLSAFTREPYGPHWPAQSPSVHVAPTQFRIGETTGSLASWESFGAWYYRLTEGRQKLPPEATRRVKQLVADAQTRRDTVRQLYRHLQERTRYVSVQLGIGGWQPFPASYVEKRNYGDCKALSNYLQALLDVVNIPSHPVLIYRGMHSPPVVPDFPSNQFNHMILAVPTARDTLWLEATDSTAPFGHVAADIANRRGLLITEDGGTLIHTPRTSASDNRLLRRARVTLSPTATSQATVTTTYTGHQQDRRRRRLAHDSPRERRDWVRKRTTIPSFQIARADFSDADTPDDTLQLSLDLKLPRYATSAGSRLFFHPNLMHRRSSIPPKMDEPRRHPVIPTPYPYVDTDTITYIIPNGYSVEALPEPVSLETSFGQYDASMERTGTNHLEYRRRLKIEKTSLPPDQYPSFRRFVQKVSRADEAQAVLVEDE